MFPFPVHIFYMILIFFNLPVIKMPSLDKNFASTRFDTPLNTDINPTG